MTLEIHPASEPAFEQRRVDEKLCFYHSVFTKTTSEGAALTRTLFVGDLVVVSCDNDHDSIPFYPCTPKKNQLPKRARPWYPLEKPWKVGQILALWGVQKQTVADMTYLCTVRWLHRFVHMPNSPSTKALRTAMNSRLRPAKYPCVLLESDHVTQGLPLHSIVTDWVVDLSQHEPFEGNDICPHYCEPSTAAIVPKRMQLVCPFRLLVDNHHNISSERAMEAVADWQHYAQLPNADTSMQRGIPPPLERAWSLPDFSTWKNNYDFMQAHRNAWAEGRTNQAEKYQKLWNKIMEFEKQADADEHEELPPTTKTTKPAPSMDKNTKPRTATTTVANKVEPPLTKTKRKPTRQGKLPIKKPNATQTQIATKKRKATTTTARNKKRRVSTETQSTAASTMVVSISTTLANTTPSNNKNEGAIDAVIPLDMVAQRDHTIYYDGVELPMTERANFTPAAQQRMSDDNNSHRRWQFRVGDLIAVVSDDSTKPPHANKKNPFFPFVQSCPWTPAQVVAIYHNESVHQNCKNGKARAKAHKNDKQVLMTVRWFGRWADIQQQHRKEIVKAAKQGDSYMAVAQQLLQFMPHAVVETDVVTKDLAVDASRVLAKVHIHQERNTIPTTLATNTKQAFALVDMFINDLGENINHVAPPLSIPIQCFHSYCISELQKGILLKPVDQDWRQYGTTKTSIRVWQRGAKLFLNDQRLLDDALVARYKTTLTARWGVPLPSTGRTTVPPAPAVSRSALKGSARNCLPSFSSSVDFGDGASDKRTRSQDAGSSNDVWNPAQWSLPTTLNIRRTCYPDDEEPKAKRRGGNKTAVDEARFHPLSNSKSVYVTPETNNPITFWDSLEVPVVPARYIDHISSNLTKKELECNCQRRYLHRVDVGDLVCVATRQEEVGLTTPAVANTDSMSQLFAPFRGPFRVGQVLAIYSQAPRVTLRSKTQRHARENLDARLEIRWFQLQAALPREWRRHPRLAAAMNNQQNGYKVNVVETDDTSSDVAASSILCSLVELLPLDVGQVSSERAGPSYQTRRRDGKKPVAPVVQCSILHDVFYWKTHQQLQAFDPISRQELRQTLFRRGLSFSKWTSDFAELQEQELYAQLVGLQTIPQKNVDQPQEEVVLWSDNDHIYLGAVTIPLMTDHLAPAALTNHGRGWTIRLGDMVAVQDGQSATAVQQFPFTMPWRPAQIVAILRDLAGDVNTMPSLEVEVRWLVRDEGNIWNAAVVRTPFRQQHQVPPKVYEDSNDSYGNSGDAPLSVIPISNLLGPINLLPNGGPSKQQRQSILYQERHFLPSTSLVYGGKLRCQDHLMDFRSIFFRSMEFSRHYKNLEQRDRVLQLFDEFYCLSVEQQESLLQGTILDQTMRMLSPKGKAPDESSSYQVIHATTPDGTLGSVITCNARIHLPAAPFHVDQGSRREYYDTLDVEPPYGNYAIRGTTNDERPSWKVRLGDMVIVHCESHSGPAYFEPPHATVKCREQSSQYPFHIGWGVAEVVCIWKCSEEGTAARDVSSPSSDTTSNLGSKVALEVRWYYRRNELPGVAKPTGNVDQTLAGSPLDYEEVVESDHVHDLSADCLLAPVNLYGTPNRSNTSAFDIGMPVLDFCCRQFFSMIRKSLIPCGVLSGRVARGRIHSRYIQGDAVLRELLGCEVGTNRAMLPACGMSFETACLNVIQKLSLTDASKESSESILIGREKEQRTIQSFLRSAIEGVTDDAGSSLFVAGPPGVGKTGCIRAAIAKLQREQAAGRLAAFRFIALNGMEMRHPFEAYIRLFEALNGHRVKKSEMEAAQGLEQYFTSTPKSDVENEVIVVLLDEIDYLVTQKQTVMYNFFDWPRRSAALYASERRGRRLIVIGVSNTLNLPERLQPRVQSRIGSRRCYFKSYNVKEIHSILKSKIDQASQNMQVFDDDAITFAARKTAAVSGDVRKAFHICRSAAEMVMNRFIHVKAAANGAFPEKTPLVRIPDVQKVSRESSNSAISKAVAQCTPFQALLLIALASLSRSTGREKQGFDVEELMMKMEALAGGSGDEQYSPPPGLQETNFMLNQLAESRIVSLETPRDASISFRASLNGMGGPWPVTSLVMDETNLLIALRGTKHNQLAQKYLSKNGF